MSRLNLDDLRRLRDEGLAAGIASGRWIKAATALMDAFPSFYETAKAMNAAAAAHVLKWEPLTERVLTDVAIASPPYTGDLWAWVPKWSMPVHCEFRSESRDGRHNAGFSIHGAGWIIAADVSHVMPYHQPAAPVTIT